MYEPILIEVSKDTDPEAWLAERRKHIMATDSARILGIAPPSWGGALAVALEKWGQAAPKEINEAMEMGEWMEDTIALLFEKKKGYKVKPSNVILIHPKHRHMGCTLDRWTETDDDLVPLEIKNVGEYFREDWENGIPEYYMIQVQHQLCVTGKPYAWVAAVIGGNKFRAHKILRDDRLIDELIEQTKKFWDMVQRHEAPAIDESPEAEKVLRYVFPTSVEGKTVTFDEEVTDFFRKLVELREDMERMKVELQAYKNKLIEAMGDAEAAFIPGSSRPVITYKGQMQRRLDSVRFAAENPELAARYYVESSTRKFLVKGEEE